ncbi:helix-turn-helix domain-containing protein [Actinorugispora endophytica]|uniref:Helix-turn-helix protein n=1 Tax=Actinorugispora endophytica TaxID=1605990 RepID=A0A4R6V7Y8_9ACTN|nr:helix-turn-helix transcriptional regulator [Actinorugispora endophytica]TDQ55229.1 helix-turn-helix protein [Actinorugispora endophytica]
MSAMTTRTPTVAQWQLSTELRNLRGERKLAEIAKAIKVNSSTVSRWETPGVEGVIPGPGSLERLLQYYDLDEQAISRFIAMRKEARTPGWWQSSGVAEDYGTYIGLETAAKRIKTHEATLIPGLLQTEDYVRALFKGTMPEAGPDLVDSALEVRLTRQKTWRENRTHLWAIVSETAIRTVLGGPKLMARQLRHLIEAAEEPNVMLQVLPFEVGAHAALEIGGFTILALEELTVLVTVTDNVSLFRDQPYDLERHSEAFERLSADAWRPAQTIEFLAETAKTLEEE